MKTNHFTVDSISNEGQQVPAIHLSGAWLASHGFQIGRRFIIYEKPGSLVLNLILPEDNDKKI